MRTVLVRLLAGLLAGGFCGGLSSGVYAAEGKSKDPDIFVAGLPLQQSIVGGDSGKFRAHHWLKDNYAGGIRDSSIEYRLPEGGSLAMKGHGLIDEGDFAGEFSLKKEKFGFLNFDYSQFRKYFDNGGGVYRRFDTLRFSELDKDLKLDIGHLRVETGLTLEKWPHLTFLYERRFKDGIKSRLSWTPVKEGNVTRNTGPSWQEIHETTDTFAIEANHQMAGISLKGEQKWESWHGKTEREEKSLSTTTAASDKKIRVQNQKPEADLLTTTLRAERWFLEDKVSTSAGYHFAHMTNHEVESIFELNENRVPTNFTNPKQVRDAKAHNVYHSHTWVGSVMFTPWRSLSFIPKFKSEVLKRKNDSAYPRDTTPVSGGGSSPDGIIDVTEESKNDTKLARWGEAISLRFTGIPRTAIYNDFEFEQIRNWLSEDRQSLPGQSASDANEVFSRETITSVRRGIWTWGVHLAPCRFFNLTSQVRHRRNNNDYDDQRETDPGANTARSAFVDWQNIHTNEFTTRAAFRPWPWLQPSFRYQLREDDYFSRFEAESASVKTEMNSQIYTFDLLLQPRPDLMTMVSYSRQNALTRTPARHSQTAANIPAFHTDVGSWLFEVGYAPKPELVLTSTLLYSRADNFDDFTDIGMPFGADHARLDLTLGVKYSLNQYVSIEPKYAFYHFKANPDAEFGDYNAHVIWLELLVHWG